MHFRIAGEEWLVQSEDCSNYIPEVGEVRHLATCNMWREQLYPNTQKTGKIKNVLECP